MATKQEHEQKIPLSLFVDKEKNRVVFAETNGDFIDILFSFLTLPLGTIIRLVSKNQQQHHSTNDQPQEEITIGCMNNLYKSVEDLSDGVFWNNICKRMLLYPRNPCESLCQKLKLNVDDSEPTKYFICSACPEGKGMMSTFVGASCSCGSLMDKEIKLHGDYDEEDDSEDGVFVRREKLYLVFDDLYVLQSSPSKTLNELQNLGYSDINKLTHMSINVGLKEILDLLKKALTSKSPLSDLFLGNEESYQKCTFSPCPSRSIYTTNMYLKIIVRKSEKKVLYAEADGGFVNFLFSFLTTPIGTILKELEEINFSLVCMDRIRHAVNVLTMILSFRDPYCFIRPTDHLIPNPKVASQFGYMRQPLKNLCEAETPNYRYDNGGVKKDIDVVHPKQKIKLFDPRSPDGTIESAVGFVRSSKFVVWDNLQVTPLDNNTSSITFLQNLNIPLDDLKVHEVAITDIKAQNLLGASLSSSQAVLTETFFPPVKKPKEEAK